MGLQKRKTYAEQMGRLGHLTRHPEQATPAELDDLAEAYILGGMPTPRNSTWLTGRQMETRQDREFQLGDHVERVRRQPGSWLGSLPKLPRIKKASNL